MIEIEIDTWSKKNLYACSCILLLTQFEYAWNIRSSIYKDLKKCSEVRFAWMATKTPCPPFWRSEFLQASIGNITRIIQDPSPLLTLCTPRRRLPAWLKTQMAQILMASKRQAGSSQRVTCKQGRFIISKQKPTIWSHISWHFIMIQKIYPHSCLWQVCLFAPWKSYLNKTHRFLRPLCNPGPPRAGMALALCPTSMVTHFAMD